MQILLFAISLFLFTFLYLFVLLLLFWSETFGKKKSQFIFWILKINRKYCLNQPFEHIFLWFHLSNCGWRVPYNILEFLFILYANNLHYFVFANASNIQRKGFSCDYNDAWDDFIHICMSTLLQLYEASFSVTLLDA